MAFCFFLSNSFFFNSDYRLIWYTKCCALISLQFALLCKQPCIQCTQVYFTAVASYHPYLCLHSCTSGENSVSPDPIIVTSAQIIQRVKKQYAVQVLQGCQFCFARFFFSAGNSVFCHLSSCFWFDKVGSSVYEP